MLSVSTATSASTGAATADFRRHLVSADAQRAVHWIVRSADHHGLPFAVVDKNNARLYVFDASGKLQGDSAALLGQTPGDEIAPHVGAHAAAGFVPVHERTTPAGRFVSKPGRNLQGEAIVWVDYESAFAIHRLRPGAAHATRAARLASPTPQDNRMSLGCVIVPVAFYTSVVERVLGRSSAVVYVLPESGSLRDVFNAL
ncbi:MAG: L,D-transpeptidase [Ramlibacter sp.]|nr:L,D-transpeptidase [Ramlibacter sp.]